MFGKEKVKTLADFLLRFFCIDMFFQRSLFVLLTSFSPFVISAMPVLNAADPALQNEGIIYSTSQDNWSLRAAFRGDYVYDRVMDSASNSLSYYNLYANEGILTLNIRKRCDLYGFAGRARQGFAGIFVNSVGIKGEVAVSCPSQLIWGFGIKGLLWQTYDCYHRPKSFLSLSLDYESIKKANSSGCTVNGSLANARTLESLLYTETQVSLAWAYKIDFLVPYVALTWNNARANMPLSSITAEGGSFVISQIKNRRSWGWVLGTNLVSASCMTIAAEARFITEKALTVVASIRF